MRIDTTGNYTDLYQITMGQAYFNEGSLDRRAGFDYFFRKLPFEGGYVVFAGLEDVLDILENLHFSVEDIDYLESRGIDRDFLKVLREFRFRGDVYSVREGEIVFPTAPLLHVSGTILETQLVETMILNTLNFQSLIATKASRIHHAAEGKILSDFGMRRAQGTGAIAAARAAVVGGFTSTSNVSAAQKYGIPSEGTMAHSFIQWHTDELTAFRKYAETRPEDTVLLVDTYNTLKSGVPNAITVAKEMEQRGHRLRAIRLDSGDLAFFSRKARAMLDEAGLHYVRIAASNQLNEYVIRSLQHQKAPIDIFGVGTSLVTGHPDGALDGVYKLAHAHGDPRIKVSENLQKVTLPGEKQVHRYFNGDTGFYGVDAVSMLEESAPTKIIHPFEEHKSLELDGLRAEPLLRPVMKNGRRTGSALSLADIADYRESRMELLPPEYKRFEYPHLYKVGISEELHKLRNALRERFAHK